MGLQNFEKDFKKKLQDREVTPSAGSWDKLEAKLDNSGDRKSYYFWWMGIAACMAGAVFMLTQFNSDPAVPDSPQFVETPVEAEEAEEVPGVREIPVVEETQIATEDSKEPVETPEIKKQQPILVRPAGESVAAVERQEKELSEFPGKEDLASPVEEEIISAKLEEVVAAISIREESRTVSDAEIEALLEEAAADINRQRYSESRVVNVDHESLLWEVEMELERSFREKVLDILKEGYMKTRTAVANRNF